MDKTLLRKAYLLEGEITSCEDDIKNIRELLSDYERFGSTITFKRNKDDRNISFGTLKFKLRAPIENMMKGVLIEKEQELINLKDKFNAL